MKTAALIFLLVVFSAVSLPVQAQANQVVAAVAPNWPANAHVKLPQTVEVLVDTDGLQGNVVETKVLGAENEFSRAAKEAAMLWKFAPMKAKKVKLVFVFKAANKNDEARATFFPPYRVEVGHR
jgi:hypothetical protein